MPHGSVGVYCSSVIIGKVSATLRAPHETFMAWVVIVQKGMSSSFKRKKVREIAFPGNGTPCVSFDGNYAMCFYGRKNEIEQSVRTERGWKKSTS